MVNNNSSIELPLSRGEVSFIDSEDSDLANMKWTLLLTRGGNKYAYRPENEQFKYLHRVILERMLGRTLEKHDRVDHINNNGLDNRRSNLRLATHQQNQFNSKNRKNNTSGYKGVHLCKRTGKWIAQIKFNYRRIFIGRFDTPELAHKAYCDKAMELHGEFARFE